MGNKPNANPKCMTSEKTKQKKNKNSCDLGYTKISQINIKSIIHIQFHHN